MLNVYSIMNMLYCYEFRTFFLSLNETKIVTSENIINGLCCYIVFDHLLKIFGSYSKGTPNRLLIAREL